MNSNKRTIINVIAQYVRTIINICLSLYSTRLVLEALGESDYGIFMLVGGVITMLAFIVNSMVITTQRFLSFFYGKNEADKVKLYFNNSLMLHLILGVLLVVLLLFFALLFFDKLNIDTDRMQVAHSVFYILMFNLILSFITAPFRAAFIAKENIVFISCVDVIDGLLKVVLVIYLLPLFSDKLISYTHILTAIAILNFLAFSLVATNKYKEINLIPKKSLLKSKIIYKLFGFAGWTTYSTGCIIGRTQGLAIILNVVYGTVINAAYGIAIQVSNSINFLAQAIVNALSPRVVKAEGAGNRNEMFKLANKTSKFCFLLLAIFAIPIVFEMPDILKFWLGKNYNDNAVMFCRFILIAAICDQTTVGHGLANQAIGKIRNYTLVVNTIKLFTLPLAIVAIFIWKDVKYSMIVFLVIECICAVTRLIFMKITAKMSVSEYFDNVLAKIILPLIGIIGASWAITQFVHFTNRFFLTGVISVAIGLILIFYTALDVDERNFVRNVLRKKTSTN